MAAQHKMIKLLSGLQRLSTPGNSTIITYRFLSNPRFNTRRHILGASGLWRSPNTRAFKTTAAVFDKDSENEDPHAEEQEREHVFSPMHERDMVDRVESHSQQMSLDNVAGSSMAASDIDARGNAEQYEGHSTGGVSLSGVMETNVPEPFQSESSVRASPTHMNNLGGGSNRADKFLQGHIKDVHPSRQYSTFTSERTMSDNRKVPLPPAENFYMPNSDAQGIQGDIQSNQEDMRLENPCPQGVQGYECENFKLWLDNCARYGHRGCNDNLEAFKLGRKTLSDIFAEQERMIHLVKQRRHYSTGPSSSNASGKDSDSVSKGRIPDAELSQKDKLKRAVKEYGGTVIVFHVAISLVSLGTAYLAVSSGLDVGGIIEKIGGTQGSLESRLATGTSTFVVAYAVHKVFAPARIATTLAATPFIVRYLRKIGVLKPPKIT